MWGKMVPGLALMVLNLSSHPWLKGCHISDESVRVFIEELFKNDLNFHAAKLLTKMCDSK